MHGLVERCSSAEMRAATVPNLNFRRVSSDDREDDLRIKREFITLKELLGAGQFSNVYKGLLSQPGCPPVTVAGNF